MEQSSHDMNNHNHSLQRKAAIAWGKCTDHQGKVTISPIPNFDLDKTIFGGVASPLTRRLLKDKTPVDIQRMREVARNQKPLQSISKLH